VRVSTSCDRSGDSTDVGISPGFIFRSLALMASDLVDASASDSIGDGAHDLAADLRFVGDRSTRCAAENRVADALARAHDEGRPVVIVAHSLGALVAWGYFEHRSATSERDVPDVERLVTVGSPIGNDGLRELLSDDVADVSLPRGVRSWVNAVNTDDPIAARLVAYDSTSGRAREMRGISDIVTERVDEDAHDLRTYLRDSSTARAVVGAWCDAATVRGRIAGCVALSKP
jgi:pimeloyl-ACP methyl ester carboxylesterase